MVTIVHWNPHKRLAASGVLRHVRLIPRVNNFGDLLGPLIANRLLFRLGIPQSRKRGRVLTVGSILHFARSGDVVWGSGINGKIADQRYPQLDIRAVRGPLTAGILRADGHQVPDVYGDPALLIPTLWTESELGVRRGSREMVYVPNLHDRSRFPDSALDPCAPVWEVVRTIASARLVVASSLHAIVIAEAFGVPVAPVRATAESEFKYADYFAGTGRETPRFAGSWEAAESYVIPSRLDWDPRPLMEAFPADAWRTEPTAER